jgi:hypothetical protein
MPNKNFKENKFKRFIAKSLQPFLRVFAKRTYISWQYRYITGHKMVWKNPTRFTAKLQILRYDIYPYDPLVIRAAGRVTVRDYVTEKGLGDYLIPIYGVYDRFEDIDFSKLPNLFVIKASHACAFNYICKDKSTLDLKMLKKKCHKWLRTNYGKKTLELHYSKIKPQLIIEEYVGSDTALPEEYKISVFNGTPKYLYHVTGRGGDIRYNNMDAEFKPFDGAQFNHWSKSDITPQKPPQFEEMMHLAGILGQDFPYVRADFFLVDGKIYFNELTFTPAKGTLIFDDDSVDELMGGWLDISNAKRNAGASTRRT